MFFRFSAGLRGESKKSREDEMLSNCDKIAEISAENQKGTCPVEILTAPDPPILVVGCFPTVQRNYGADSPFVLGGD
jgi:hypothetical protein